VPWRFAILESASSAINSIPPNKCVYLSTYKRKMRINVVALCLIRGKPFIENSGGYTKDLKSAG